MVDMVSILKYASILVAILFVLWLIFWVCGLKKNTPVFGVSFHEEYAASLGLHPREVYRSMLTELSPASVRLSAMWKEIEATKGTYDFSSLDWYMNEAAAHETKVVLVVGQKAPRWPECHVPPWIKEESKEDAHVKLLAYVQETVNRYKEHPALEFWQVENEPFIRFSFGECEGYDPSAISDEIALVRAQDAVHQIVITDSGELGLWYRAAKTGDIFGTTLYRMVRLPSGKIFSYDWLPSGFYRLKAALLGIKNDAFWVSELQAEPWFSSGNPHDTSVQEQEETMTVERMKKHVDYAERLGASRVYLWGVEWWYFMRERHGEEGYIDYAKAVFGQGQGES